MQTGTGHCTKGKGQTKFSKYLRRALFSAILFWRIKYWRLTGQYVRRLQQIFADIEQLQGRPSPSYVLDAGDVNTQSDLTSTEDDELFIQRFLNSIRPFPTDFNGVLRLDSTIESPNQPRQMTSAIHDAEQAVSDIDNLNAVHGAVISVQSYLTIANM